MKKFVKRRTLTSSYSLSLNNSPADESSSSFGMSAALSSFGTSAALSTGSLESSLEDEADARGMATLEDEVDVRAICVVWNRRNELE